MCCLHGFLSTVGLSFGSYRLLCSDAKSFETCRADFSGTSMTSSHSNSSSPNSLVFCLRFFYICWFCTLSWRSLLWFLSSLVRLERSLSFLGSDFLVWIMFWILKLMDMASPIRTISLGSPRASLSFFYLRFYAPELPLVLYLFIVLKFRALLFLRVLSSYSSVCCFTPFL